MRRLGLETLLLLATGPMALAQMPSISAVVDSARYGTRLAPGSLATLFGYNFGSIPRELTVLVGGKPASVLQVVMTQANIQIPIDVPTGPASVTAERLSQRSLPFNITIDAHAPALFVRNPQIFSQNPNAVGEGIFLGADGTPIEKDRPASPGESVSVLAAGLGATSPVVPTGAVAPSDPLAQTVTAPRVTVVGKEAKEATVLVSALAPGQVGLYQVVFQVPIGLEEGTYRVTLEIGGVQSNTVTVLVGRPSPQVTSIVNGASFRSPGVIAPGSIVSLFGANFGAKDRLTGFPATDFEGVSVLFGGRAVPLFALIASRNQINLLAPTELPESGNVDVQVRVGATTSLALRLKLAAAQPGIFFISDPSNPVRRTAAALLAGTAWRVMPSSQARALGMPGECAGLSVFALCGQPAAVGDNIQVYATGLGKATPGGDPAGLVLPTGSVAPAGGNPLYRTVQVPTVTVGGVPALVQFSGLAPGFAGLYQVNIQIPPGAPGGDDVAVTVSLPGAPSDTATIAVRR